MEGTPEPLPGWEVLPGDVSFRLMNMQFSVLHSRISKPSPIPGTPLLPQSFALFFFPPQYSSDAVLTLTGRGFAWRISGLLPLALSCLFACVWVK